jgi:hypothetical protein
LRTFSAGIPQILDEISALKTEILTDFQRITIEISGLRTSSARIPQLLDEVSVLKSRVLAIEFPEGEPESSKEAKELLEKGENIDFLIMGNTKWTELLLEFCQSDWGRDLVYGYREIQNYRKLKGSLLKGEFNRIRQKFIEEGAPSQINFSADMRQRIVRRAENGGPTVDIFDEALVEIEKISKVSILPNFRKWMKTKEFVAQLKAKTDPRNWTKSGKKKK